MEAPVYRDIFKQIFKNLEWCGIPSDDSRLGLKFYVLFTILLLILIEELSFFITKVSSEEFLILTGSIPCILIGVRSSLKIASIAQKRRKIFKLSKSLDKLYLEIVSDESKRRLVCDEINRVKLLTKYYFLLSFMLILVYNFSTVLICIFVYLTKGIIVFTLPYPIIVPFSTEVFYNKVVVYLHSISSGKHIILTVFISSFTYLFHIVSYEF